MLPPGGLFLSWLSPGIGSARAAAARRVRALFRLHLGAVGAATSERSLTLCHKAFISKLPPQTIRQGWAGLITAPIDAWGLDLVQRHPPPPPALGEGQMLLGHECIAGLA